MSATFIDTSFLIAVVNPKDEFHNLATGLIESHPGPFITTQFVLTEFLDAYCSTATRTAAAAFVATLEARPNLSVIPVSDDWFHRGTKRYQARTDKEWSLTDCVSFLVMEDWSIELALSSDHHFEQAGFTILLKDKE